MKMDFSFSIILPTFNEEESLSTFIPSLVDGLKNEDYEIIVVDDKSNDNTVGVVNDFSAKNEKIKIIQRSGNRSLPLSIYEGISASKSKFVMWLDADGSMDVDSVIKLVNSIKAKKDYVYIGSRFVKGGGYKGKEKISNLNLKNFYFNIVKSEDAILAVFLSLVFNKMLSILLPLNIKDLTSGFIIGKKEYFVQEMFEGFTYGEYFINVVTELHKSNILMKEIGYFCKPRVHGESKTSTNLFRLVSLSKPYIKTALNSRKKINENY